MRIQTLDYDKDEQEKFCKYLLDVGNGTTIIPDIDGNTYIALDKKMCVWSLEELINIIFPDVTTNLNWNKFDGRAILSTCNNAVDMINDKLIEQLPGKEYTYYSQNHVKEKECKLFIFIIIFY